MLKYTQVAYIATKVKNMGFQVCAWIQLLVIWAIPTSKGAYSTHIGLGSCEHRAVYYTTLGLTKWNLSCPTNFKWQRLSHTCAEKTGHALNESCCELNECMENSRAVARGQHPAFECEHLQAVQNADPYIEQVQLQENFLNSIVSEHKLISKSRSAQIYIVMPEEMVKVLCTHGCHYLISLKDIFTFQCIHVSISMGKTKPLLVQI